MINGKTYYNFQFWLNFNLHYLKPFLGNTVWIAIKLIWVPKVAVVSLFTIQIFLFLHGLDVAPIKYLSKPQKMQYWHLNSFLQQLSPKSIIFCCSLNWNEQKLRKKNKQGLTLVVFHCLNQFLHVSFKPFHPTTSPVISYHFYSHHPTIWFSLRGCRT